MVEEIPANCTPCALLLLFQPWNLIISVESYSEGKDASVFVCAVTNNKFHYSVTFVKIAYSY